jgi:hypothetical protein
MRKLRSDRVHDALLDGRHRYCGVAAAIIGGAVVGAGASMISSSKAAGAQEDAANKADQTQQQMYDQTRADNMPWHDAGVTALNQLSAGTAPGGEFMHTFTKNDFQQDPGYQFRLQQGQEALDNSAASRGGLLSGAQLRATADYNQNFASNEYSNAYNRFNNDESLKFNRLSGVAGTGQTANNLIDQTGTSAANQISSNQVGAGNARASGYMGAANALTGAISQGWNTYNQTNALNSLSQARLYGSANNWGGGYNADGSFSPNTYGTGANPYSGTNALSNNGWGIE